MSNSESNPPDERQDMPNETAAIANAPSSDDGSADTFCSSDNSSTTSAASPVSTPDPSDRTSVVGQMNGGENTGAEDTTKFGDNLNLDDAARLKLTEELLDEHSDVIYRYAYRLTGCSSAAEDIAQEVYLRAFRSIHQLREPGAAKGWLLVIARNEFARWCKKKSSALSIDNEATSPPEETRLPENNAGQLETREWVEDGLNRLPEDYRLVVLMYYFEQLSYAEVAEQLNIPIGTVMSRLSRGKKYLKAELEKTQQ